MWFKPERGEAGCGSDAVADGGQESRLRGHLELVERRFDATNQRTNCSKFDVCTVVW
jgi:hypothetical protein